MSTVHEFSLIDKFFKRRSQLRQDVLVGIGDDCALVQVPANKTLAISCDTLIAGIHFPEATTPYDIGFKALAVNLSDLAAMGAEPAWVTLALTLPETNSQWLEEFSRGFFELINRYSLTLIGGDTTHGSCLSMTVQVHGFVAAQQALARHKAQVGDQIYVTGQLGLAGYALQLLQQDKLSSSAQVQLLSQRLNRPEPRIRAGIALCNIANAAIDISDGLAADLSHILDSSKVGATIWTDKLPVAPLHNENLAAETIHLLALTAGDDYELCFTVPKQHHKQLEKIFDELATPYSCIGIIEHTPGLRIVNQQGQLQTLSNAGYQHF